MDDQTVAPGAKHSGGATSQPTRSALGIVVDGRYRIVQPLAEGGMGSVYLGEQGNLNRQVAIKLVRQPDPDSAVRFRREAEALAAVSHPAIVDVYDYLHEPSADVSYLVMAYVQGENVADFAAQRPGGVLTPLESVELMLPVASALVELHSHQILHRDLKPANLVRYVRADGRPAVKLVDFGIARREQDAGLTAEGLIVGTPPYLCAEVVLGKRHSEASDVYAFAATLFELMAGDPPHGRDEVHKVLKRIISEDVKLPPGLAGTDLGRLLLAMLAREPEGRPTIQAALESLERIRLALVQQTGDVAAVVEATRAMVCTDAPTVALQSVGATAQGGGAPGSTAQATPGAARGTTTEPASRAGASGPGPLPWIIAGGAVLLALGVTLYFTLRKAPRPAPGKSRPVAAAAGGEAQEGMDAVPAMGAVTPMERQRPAMPPDMKEVRPRPKAGGAAEVSVEAVAKERARCTGRTRAYAMFRRATWHYRMKLKIPWVKAVFVALLSCEHASLSQKRWVAYRLALLHTKAGHCGFADFRWKQYVAAARKLGAPPFRRPPCKQRRSK